MDLSVFFAGTAGSVPTARRGLPAVLIRRGGERLLFDCGEGTQRQLVRSVGLLDLDEVFLTHFHADHWLGLPGLLKTFDLRGRERPLIIHGPRGLRELIALGLRSAGRVRFELVLNELEPGQVLSEPGIRSLRLRWLIGARPLATCSLRPSDRGSSIRRRRFAGADPRSRVWSGAAGPGGQGRLT